MSLKKTAVLIITHNGKNHLKDCIDSLSRQSYKDFDTFLIDNASNDGSTEFVKRNYSWVNIIKFKKNYGFAQGYNIAVRKLSHSYVAFLNDDTRVNEHWLKELIKEISKDDSIFAVGSKILFFNNPQIINHAGALITVIGAGIDVGIYEKDSAEYNQKKQIGAVCGAGMLVNKELFNQLGGFDQDYFAYFEDLDLCWRAWLFGYEVYYVPSSIVYHKFGGSWGDRNSFNRIFFCQKNKIANVLKNYESKNVLLAFSVMFFYEIIRILFFIKNREIVNIKAIYKGTLDALTSIPAALDKRRKIQSYRKLSDDELNKKGLILSFHQSVREFMRLNNK